MSTTARPPGQLTVSWPGRTAVRTLTSFGRVGLFDRSMTIAAQLFTSVFPLLILLAAWATRSDADQIGNAIDLPEQSQAVLEDAVTAAGDASFGVVGALLVLASATGVSRALTRAFAAIWELPPPKPGLKSAWRWIAVVVAIVLSLLAIRGLGALLDDLPPDDVWPVAVSFACDITVALFVPWVLLAGLVRPRMLLPGALIGALISAFARPALSEWFPNALQDSADQYGTIGVAFTYVALLYVVALVFLGTAILGQVIATDGGAFGQWIRGDAHATEPSDDSATSDVLT